MYYDIVFHFDKGIEDLKVTISNIKNYYTGLPKENFKAVLVVNGPGIKLMGKESSFSSDLKELHGKGLDIRVCNNAMIHFNLKSGWLNPVCRIVPAGLLELVDLQRKGFVYIKP